jgi:hypothetical protein
MKVLKHVISSILFLIFLYLALFWTTNIYGRPVIERAVWDRVNKNTACRHEVFLDEPKYPLLIDISVNQYCDVLAGGGCVETYVWFFGYTKKVKIKFVWIS